VAPATPAAASGHDARAGRELNRIAVKTEGLQDSLVDQGLKGLKISGQMDPTWIYNRARTTPPSSS